MNQPTREEFEAFKAEVKEEVRQLREQVTEPINVKVERRDVASEYLLQRTFDEVARINPKVGQLEVKTDRIQRDVETLKGDVNTLKQDVAAIRTDMQKRFDAIAQVQQLILARLPEKGE
jgi:outer membrane murein-binding lipoprotein Lpp